MRILAISDTHGNLNNFKKLIKNEEPFDMLIHLGDTEGDEDEIKKLAGCPCSIVAGNNDFFSELPREEEIYLMGHKLLLTHGHYYFVGMGSEQIKSEARSRDCDIVMFGHTHRPVVDRDQDVIAINPGSLSYPRQEGRRPSYAIIELDENNGVEARILYM